METNRPISSDQAKPETSARGASRAGALRLLLGGPQLKESFALSMQPALGSHCLAGLQAAVTALVALPLFQLSPWPHLSGFAALGAPVALFGRFATGKCRVLIVLRCVLVQVCAVFLMSTASWLVEPPAARLIILALLSGLLFFVATGAGLNLPGPLIFVLAASASLDTISAWEIVFEQTLATAAVAGLAVLICCVTEIVRHRPKEEMPGVAPLQPLRHRLLVAARVAAGTAAAMLLAYGLNAAHPGWAAVGVVAVMQGAHLRINMNRAVQRTIGTACGALVAWPLLACQPSIWAIILALACLMVVTEVVIGWNYALGPLAITPMALLMSQLSSPDAITVAAVPERILDTLLGAVVAIVIAVLYSTFDDRLHLANHHARAGRNADS